jgi:Flp pilus assembly protein TadG
MVVPLLLAMLVGIIEFGWLVRNNYAVSNATREGARFAALGKTTTQTQDRTREASPFTIANSNIVLTYFNSSTNTWVAWPTETTSKNAVPVDAPLRVLVRVQHRPLTGFFPLLRSRFIEQSTVMRREL